MSQNDMVIANQTAPNFRADLNLALQALASTSSGSSAPATTYANMLWYDTSSNILKMRSEADDAWIEIGTLDQSGNTFSPSGLANLTQAQVEDDTSTVFGQVSGQRLAQAIATSRENGGTIVATTSGTAFDFTSIPAEVQEVVVAFDGVSFSGTDHLLVQLGTSGGFVTTGYSSSSSALFASGSLGLGSTSGFLLRLGSAAFAVYGQMTIRRLAPSSNVWVQNHGGHVDTSSAVTGGGGITLAGELTQVRITRTGTNTFDAGQLNVRWK